MAGFAVWSGAVFKIIMSCSKDSVLLSEYMHKTQINELIQ